MSKDLAHCHSGGRPPVRVVILKLSLANLRLRHLRLPARLNVIVTQAPPSFVTVTVTVPVAARVGHHVSPSVGGLSKSGDFLKVSTPAASMANVGSVGCRPRPM